MGKRGNGEKKGNATAKRIVVAFGVLLAGILLLVGFFIWKAGRSVVPAVSPREADTVTIRKPVPASVVPVIADTARNVEIPIAAPVIKKHAPLTKKPPDSIPKDNPPQPAVADSETTEGDTLFPAEFSDCSGDTLALWVYPEPSGGLHRGPVAINFHANKPCSVSWRFASDSIWNTWSEAPITVEQTATIEYRAVDGCGRALDKREEYYEIERAEATEACPGGMEFVKVGTTQFCIDRYEWPNRKGTVPVSYVSLYQATDSCFSVGKRLCSSEEWSIACSGPYSWPYSYGQNYEPYGCNTHDTVPWPSGSKPECRAYFGVFDMSGNIAEWTATPAKENRHYYNVLGGFWESGPRSGCFDIRYSYFPQNRHNPVGFRCCKDIASKR